MSPTPSRALSLPLLGSPAFQLAALAGGVLGIYSNWGTLPFEQSSSLVLSGVLLSLCGAGVLLRRNQRAPVVPEQGKVLDEITKERNELAEEYRQLTKNLPAAVTVRDPQGKLTFCSPYTEVLTGYALQEILAAPGDFFLSLVHEEDKERYVHALRYGSEGERFNYRYRIVHRSGIELWVETRTHPIFNDYGELTALLSITLDVDLAVRYQRQVELKNIELEEVTYMVSHDLKAPIVTLKGMVDILEQEYGAQLGADGSEVLGHVKGASQRLDQLVHSVLEYARLGSEEVRQENVPLTPLLQEIVADLTSQIEAAQATVTLPEQPLSVQGDRIKLYRIFSNLISNALKYREVSRPSTIEVATKLLRGERYVEISVTDNGMGIAEAKQANVFRPFQRARTQRTDGTVIEGSGIGLASVKKLLDRIGGEVQLESTEGAGTTVRIILRRALEDE